MMTTSKRPADVPRHATGLYCNGKSEWRCAEHLPEGARLWTGDYSDREGWDYRRATWLRGYAMVRACVACGYDGMEARQ